MKKIVLDTKRSQVLFADTVEQDGDSVTVISGGRKRMIQLDKIAYIEDVSAEDGLKKHIPDPVTPRAEPPPPPVMSSMQPQIKLSSTFSDAVEKRLRDAPPPDPYDDRPPPTSDSRISVELIGSASGSYDILTDRESFVADHVKERLVTDIFSNAALKESLKQHNVVGIVKNGSLVTLDCRLKPAIQPPAVSASVNNLVNSIVSMVSPSVKLPDLPLQAGNEDT